MADEKYVFDENAVYNPNIRKLKTSDPANADTVFNPLFQQIISNTHAVKKQADLSASKLSNIQGEAASKDHIHDDRYLTKQQTEARLKAGYLSVGSERVMLAQSTDLNTLKTPGSYATATGAISNSCLNIPKSMTQPFLLNVIQYGTGAGILQEVREYGDSQIYSRFFTSSWTAWKAAGDGLKLTSDPVIAKNGLNITPITVEPGDSNGSAVKVGSGGMTVVGGGESARAVYNNLIAGGKGAGTEELHLAADTTITLHTACNTLANQKTVTIDTAGKVAAPGGFQGNLTGNVTGTVSGNAGSATKLAAARTIAISGGATGTATAFDGTKNISIPVTALDVSKANAGTLAVARGGTGQTNLNNVTVGKANACNGLTFAVASAAPTTVTNNKVTFCYG